MKIYSTLLAFPLSAGLMLAQQPTQTPTETTPAQTQNEATSAGQTWTGILVASNCSTASMPKTTASSMNRTTPGNEMKSSTSPAGPMTRNPAMDRGTPTDRTTSTSDRTSDLNRKTPLSQTATDMDRGTRTDRDLNKDRARDVNQGNGTDAQLERTRSLDQTGARTTASNMDRGTRTDRDLSRDTNTGINQATGAADRSLARSTPEHMDTQAGNNATGELNNSGNWDKSCFIGTSTGSFSFQTADGRVLHFDSSGDSMIKSQLDSTNRVSTKNKIFRARVSGTVEGDTIHLTNIVM